jgi:hypothetical protein
LKSWACLVWPFQGRQRPVWNRISAMQKSYNNFWPASTQNWKLNPAAKCDLRVWEGDNVADFTTNAVNFLVFGRELFVGKGVDSFAKAHRPTRTSECVNAWIGITWQISLFWATGNLKFVGKKRYGRQKRYRIWVELWKTFSQKLLINLSKVLWVFSNNSS